MPFINTKYTAEITPQQEDALKTALGKALTLIGKSEQWLMLGFEQNCSLYFQGQKSEKIAYVEVSLLGDAGNDAYRALTAEICRQYEDILGIPADKIYIKYSPTSYWGWNGINF